MTPQYVISQGDLFGQPRPVGFGTHSFAVREIPVALARRIVVENHYSRKCFPNSTEHHGVYIRGALVGILQWGPGMNPASGGGVVAGTKPGTWLELNRMWLDDCAPRNSESRAISYSIKLIKRTRPEVQWVQSFADERCGGLGVVYQACSFLYLGEHTSTFWELDGVFYHNISATVDTSLPGRGSAAYLQDNIDRATRHDLRQFRYWREIRGGARKRLLMTPQPYPKREAPDA